MRMIERRVSVGEYLHTMGEVTRLDEREREKRATRRIRRTGDGEVGNTSKITEAK